MPVVELLAFQASEALVADPSAFHGLQIEDQSVAYLAIAWASREAEVAFKSSPEYPKAFSKLKGAQDGPLEIMRVDPDHFAALEGTVTQLAICKLRQAPLQLPGLAVKPKDGLPLGGTEIPFDLPYDKAFEPQRTCYLAVNWDVSRNKHYVFAENVDSSKSGFPDLEQVVELSLVNVTFKRLAV
ncbi:hypothetical protein DFP72DRAFT_891067 [Ephemerocybe angulata]|uniref:ABM domain-containing protein n=1 Tax=Ephemerocybe angulata TaxID=980116 RepID=A0A8H6I2C1_9AGAR|nr:hypothetical protein DFP72DRAFT_891067 [Tulosesus angulatus]